MSSEGALDEFRIGEGGLLRRVERALHLTRLIWQTVAILTVTWVPVALLGLANEHITGRPDGTLRDASVHVRLLVATPVFLYLDQLFPQMCRSALLQLTGQAFVPGAARSRFDRLLRSATRLSDATLPEVLFAMVGIGVGLGLLLGILPAPLLGRPTGASPALFWYALTDVPLFEFLLLRSLWRWAIWVRLLAGLSRIRLDLVVTHPDRRGGISFLRIPSVGYCAMLLFAISSVLCAEIGSKLTVGLTTAASFKLLLAVFAVVGTLIAFGPLLLFTPKLLRARRAGIIEYGELATDCGRRFRRRWIELSDRKDLLGTAETQPLTNIAETYRETVDRMRLLLIEGRDMVALLAATLLPMVPVMLAYVPVEDWRALMGLITGGRLL